jgi:hypothetical protein
MRNAFGILVGKTWSEVTTTEMGGQYLNVPAFGNK